MAEFVERELEQLLPVFEQLKVTQLMSADELNEFICQCRAFEYKCAKRTKRAKDFLAYAHYMADQIGTIGERRRQLKFLHRYDQIERPLKRKCAFIHRICSHRCKKIVYYREEIAFLRHANMFKQCSQAYTRLLNVHGNLVSNHDEAARFEFFDNNHSADSARDILQKALRKFPTAPRLWLTYFEIELRFVEFLHQRRMFLLQQHKSNEMKNKWQKKSNSSKRKSNGQQQNEETAQITDEEAEKFKQFNSSSNNGDDEDEVLGLKLATIVYEMAMKSVEEHPTEKTKLLRDFLRVARDCAHFADVLVQKLTDHLHALGEHAEEEEQNTIEGQLVPDEQLFAVDTEGDDDQQQQHNDQDDEMEEDEAEESTNQDTNGNKTDNNGIGITTKSTGGGGGNGSVLDGFNPDDPELKLLLSRATLTDDYDQRPLDEVLHVSARQQKKQRKAQRATTAGPSWHKMPATELTEERRRDLEVVQMRDALDPAQHYKKPDREVLPKYFQIGHIVESKADFYAARVPKRQRKRTMVEELMADAELLARNKRRFTAIVQRREATARGTFQRRGALPKWSKRKSGGKQRR
ncbi:hypothetical protein niasHS_012561 [Heterodera schachtii]|uniref:Uncharacterized protein n=1 Tax=Heterodera schachtii TaxID=97005 RepID=A0ABD2IE23_HETSC